VPCFLCKQLVVRTCSFGQTEEANSQKNKNTPKSLQSEKRHRMHARKCIQAVLLPRLTLNQALAISNPRVALRPETFEVFLGFLVSSRGE
jgi:hypothetical protein